MDEGGIASNIKYFGTLVVTELEMMEIHRETANDLNEGGLILEMKIEREIIVIA